MPVAADQVEAVRRLLNQDNAKALADTENIQTLELLGQGTVRNVSTLASAAFVRALMGLKVYWDCSHEL